MSIYPSVSVSIAAWALLFTSLPAHAALIITQRIESPAGVALYTGTGSHFSNSSGGVATVSAYTNPQPIVESSVVGLGVRLDASSVMSYAFHLEGPLGVVVPIKVNGYYELLARGTSNAGFSLTLYAGSASFGRDVGYVRENIYSYISPTYGTDDMVFHSTERLVDDLYFSSERGVPNQALFSGPAQISADFEAFQTVVLELRTHASTSSGLTGNARALLDPLIYIDPSFADRDLFRIVMDDGVPNVGLTPVPEPATYGLAGSLLLAAVGFFRTRKRVSVTGETAS